MHDTAAHLVDRVLPFAPWRQWVLSFPFSLRLRLARNSELLRRLRDIFMRSIRAWQRLQARRLGLKDAKTAAVCFTQRFDSKLATNLHLHAIVADGVFVEDEDGRVVFRRLPKPTQADVEQVARRIARRSLALLSRLDGEEQAPEALDQLRARSMGAQLTLKGTPAGAARPRAKLAALVEGFSLEAGRHVHEHDREGLERLCRYTLRPPLALERMAPGPSGRLIVRLKRPLADGTCAIELTPTELLRRLAGLVPPPRRHDIGYFGLLGSRSDWRRRIVPAPPPRRSARCAATHQTSEAQLELPLVESAAELAAVVEPGNLSEGGLRLVKAPNPRERYLDWATLLRRVHRVEVLRCPCGGTRVVTAFVEDPKLAVEVLEKLGLPT